MRWLCLIVAVLTLVALPPALAVEPDEILSDPALEARARALSKDLRCMLCQKQAIEIQSFFEAFRPYQTLISPTARGKEALPILLCNGCPSAPPHQRWSDRYDCERSRSKIAHPLGASSRSAC